MREHLLLGQNVTPRRRTIRAWKLFAGALFALVSSDFACYEIGAKAHSAPSWPPAKVHLIPAIPEPQGHVMAYLSTDQTWIVAVTWEPVRPGRFLGVEKTEDADACVIHVAAEAPDNAQLRAIQAGTADCFARENQ